MVFCLLLCGCGTGKDVGATEITNAGLANTQAVYDTATKTLRLKLGNPEITLHISGSSVSGIKASESTSGPYSVFNGVANLIIESHGSADLGPLEIDGNLEVSAAKGIYVGGIIVTGGSAIGGVVGISP